MRAILLAIALALLTVPGFAVEPDEVLNDPALEARARGISSNLRCLVCQNQSIDDSDAPLAKDLRIIVRERLEAGDTDTEVMQFVVDRYGEFVLLNPVVAPHTLLLWLAAPAFLAIGAGVVLVGMRRRKGAATAGIELTEQEASALAELEESPRGR